MTNVKIAHFVEDEKFPDAAYEAFEEVLPGGNTFFIAKSRNDVKFIKKIPLVSVNRYSFLNPFFLKSLEKYDLVIVHSLSPFNKELVARASKKIKFVWIGMGFDYYDLIYPTFLSMLKPETAALYKSKIRPSGNKRNRLNIPIRIFNRVIYWRSRDKKKLVNRIDYFAPVLEEEYHHLDRLYPNMVNDFVDWNYGVTARLVEGKTITQEVSGGNILIGNSASITNNHADIFRLLEKLDLDDNVKIVCPLSYGNKRVKKYAIEKGHALFGESFVPIQDFMSFDDYMSLISSCSNVIMNHKRQQAGGNITSSLYMGARVFLDKNNLFYEEYRKNGIVINSIDELEASPWLLNTPLTADERKNNKKLLAEMRGWDTIIRKTRNLIAKCCDRPGSENENMHDTFRHLK